jgi:hypothetical protein
MQYGVPAAQDKVGVLYPQALQMPCGLYMGTFKKMNG